MTSSSSSECVRPWETIIIFWPKQYNGHCKRWVCFVGQPSLHDPRPAVVVVSLSFSCAPSSPRVKHQHKPASHGGGGGGIREYIDLCLNDLAGWLLAPLFRRSIPNANSCVADQTRPEQQERQSPKLNDLFLPLYGC